MIFFTLLYFKFLLHLKQKLLLGGIDWAEKIRPQKKKKFREKKKFENEKSYLLLSVMFGLHLKDDESFVAVAAAFQTKKFNRIK